MPPLSLELEQPSSRGQDVYSLTRKELNENVATRDADLAHIKEWLRQEPHLPDTWDEARMMTFLRGCKFSLEKCKRKLDMYFTMRTAAPEIFSNRDIRRHELQEVMKMVEMPPLPTLTPDGRRVVIVRGTGADKDIKPPAVAEGFKLIFMIGDVRLAEEIEGVAGDVMILDASVATPGRFSLFSPAIIKKFFIIVEQCYPVRLKEVHVINISPIVDSIVNFVRPFIKAKIMDRVRFHSDINDLYKYVPKEILPQEYGGNAGTMAELNDAWKAKLESYVPWFQEQENIKANECLRPGKPKDYNELFGTVGSFRTLSID